MRIRAAAFASVALVFSQSFCNLQFVDAASSRVSIAPSTSATESKTTEKQDKTSSLDASAAKEAVVSAHDTSSTSSQTAQLRSLQNGPPASFIRTNGPKDITEDCILAHNKYRVGKLKHPLMPSERNSDAVYQALKFAKELMEGACEFKHSKASGFGENIYYIGGNTAKCEDAVDLWYSEIKNLNGKYPGGSWTLKEGHFTQVMWAGSTGLGCAATNGQNCEGRTIVICNYKPQGNWSGEPPFSSDIHQ